MTGGFSRVLLTPRTRWTATNAAATMRAEACHCILTSARRVVDSGQIAATPTAAIAPRPNLSRALLPYRIRSPGEQRGS